MAKVNVDKLATELMKNLDLYQQATQEIVKDAVDRSSQITVQDLEETSPRRAKNGGTYAESWASKRDTKARGKWKYSRIVYSKAPSYRLTHLLEFGHAKVNGGRTKAQPHIEPAEETAKKNLELFIVEGIKAASRK